MHAHVQRAVAVQAALVRELEVLDVPRRHGATSIVAWLRARFRISPGAAKRLATLADTTGDRTPAVTAALEAGTVNADQAAAIAKVLASVPSEVRAKAEEHLVVEAKTFGPDDLGRLGERVLEHVAPELLEQQALSALERAERIAYEKRELHVTDIAGTSKVRVHGLLDREGAAHLRAALDPLSAPRPKEDEPDPRTPAQRRADALVEVCQLANECGELPENGGDRPQVVVTIDYDQLCNGVVAKRGAGSWRATPKSSPSSSTATTRSSTSDANGAASAEASGAHSSYGTRDAPSPAVDVRRAGATHITSFTGHTAAKPAWKTASSSARTTTVLSTTASGKSTSRRDTQSSCHPTANRNPAQGGHHPVRRQSPVGRSVVLDDSAGREVRCTSWCTVPCWAH
jgi:hypothetical protein